MELDMTKGSPFRLIVKFIIPIILGNLFQQLYNLADTVIVGHFLGRRSHRYNLFPDPWLSAGTDHRLYSADRAAVWSR